MWYQKGSNAKMAQRPRWREQGAMGIYHHCLDTERWEDKAQTAKESKER